LRIYGKRHYEKEAEAQTWKTSLTRVLIDRGYKENECGGWFLPDKTCGRYHVDHMDIKQVGRFAIQIDVHDADFIAEAEAVGRALEEEGYYVELMVPDREDAQPATAPSLTIDAVSPAELTAYLKSLGWAPWIHAIGEFSFDKQDDLGSYRITLADTWTQEAKWAEAREKLIGEIAIIEGVERTQLEQDLIAFVAERHPSATSKQAVDNHKTGDGTDVTL
jgi:hypothetical protein